MGFMSLRVRIARLAVLAGLLGFVPGVLPAVASAEACPNEQLRSEQGDQHLPDCRAYELVTPADKGATTPLSVEKNPPIFAVAEDGSGVWIRGLPMIGEDPTARGMNAVFSRTPSGWAMTSLQPPSAGETAYQPDIFNPDLTMLGVETTTEPYLELGPSLEHTFLVGAPGGPYASIATTVDEELGEGEFKNGHFDFLAGASEDFSHVVLTSADHDLLPAAGETVTGGHDLYEWSRATEKLQLVNVTSGGSLVSDCGAGLGNGARYNEGPGFQNPMSSDGSKIFFAAPDRFMESSGEASCKEPRRLYMRLNGDETVEISKPEPGVVDPSGYHSSRFVAATLDGSRVWFVSTTELTANDTGHALELYEYNTITRKLVCVSRGESGTAEGNIVYASEVPERQFTFSEDGSIVYFQAHGKLTADTPAAFGEGSSETNIYRYDTETGAIKYVATAEQTDESVDMVASAEGGELVFNAKHASGPRGVVYDDPSDQPEVYRYDVAEENLICVSCRPDGEPSVGASFIPQNATGGSDSFFNGLEGRGHPISDGGREVFFTSTDAIIPQDTTEAASEHMGPASDVYEWESDGTGSCTEQSGCLSLISTPTSGHGSEFLGAGANGDDVFFLTSSALVPQDLDTVGDLYDARVDGGFVAPSTVPCSGEDCRLVPNTPPVFGTPQSEAFVGAGNPLPVALVKPKAAVKKKKPKKKKPPAKKSNKRKARKTRAHRAGAGSPGVHKANNGGSR
jgi:hypothetical protein